ncbi:PEP-CTERM sorting domain-containing protein [Luteolibacter flavescens]|uniref:PEP-CTERM sorting domain-containing protein n=1 Tax=Luteolibacter flavescens TaxID=1859460 RepID=A0ABT3FJY3_9BACT|nr:PEP-CTERM sorting domain-containing protein [Luteolibacter flavescens]MCW1883860.1 PEP-CTERM sorting domain-containing protein [Luteolibacter flavescens]
MKINALLFASVGLISSSFAASTLNLRNFSGVSVGLPIVNSEGAAVAVNSFHANAGYFNTTINWSTATAEIIKSAFVGIDTSPINGGTRSGLFTGQTFNGTLPAGFAGSQAYVVIANNADFSLATHFAVVAANVAFTGPDGFGNSAQTLDALSAANVVFGTVRQVTTQPDNLANAAFVSGVEMITAVPEPSIALLGALGVFGLVRRRR